MFTAEAQPLTGLTSAAFSEMAQWRGVTPAPGSDQHAANVRLLNACSTSGPASPMREGVSPSLEVEISFDYDEDALTTPGGLGMNLAGLASGLTNPTPRGKPGPNPRTAGRKRGEKANKQGCETFDGQGEDGRTKILIKISD